MFVRIIHGDKANHLASLKAGSFKNFVLPCFSMESKGNIISDNAWKIETWVQRKTERPTKYKWFWPQFLNCVHLYCLCVCHCCLRIKEKKIYSGNIWKNMLQVLTSVIDKIWKCCPGTRIWMTLWNYRIMAIDIFIANAFLLSAIWHVEFQFRSICSTSLMCPAYTFPTELLDPYNMAALMGSRLRKQG